jgi:hypothetical protein
MQLDQIRQFEQSNSQALLPRIRDKIPMQIGRPKPFTTSRTVLAGTVNASTTTDTFGAVAVSLSTLPNSTEFTTLFDAWRILEIYVTFLPIAPLSNTAAYPALYTVIDLDDANTPAAVTDLTQYETCQTTVGRSLTTRVFSPRFNIGTTGVRAEPFAWIDVASSTTNYYGLKYAMPTLGTTGFGAGTPVYQIDVRAVIQLREVR